MSIQTVPFTPRFVDDAVDLVTHRYRQLRETVSALPTRYEQADVLRPILDEICTNGSGVAASENDRFVGFMLAWNISNFRGRQTAYSPEWANAATLDRAGPVYERMLATATADWYHTGVTSFITALFADSEGAADTHYRLGFGVLAMDALRDLSLPTGEQADVEIRRATVDDLAAVEELDIGLHRHLQAAPTFLLQATPQDKEEIAQELADERYRYFLATEDGKAVAFIKIGPATEDASTIIRDEGTASITGAFALPSVRGNGISTALLARCIEWAKEAGYERCGVDFEPTNIEANRFWRRHFQPVCFGVQRLLNIE